MASIRIQTNRLKNEMIIQADVYTNNGVVIVPKGTSVTKEVYDILTRHFVEEVIVDYVPKKTVDKDRKKEELSRCFQIAEKSLSNDFREIVSSDKEIDVRALLNTVQDIVNNAGSESELCDMLFSMEIASSNLYVHSIHVALYSRLLAGWVKLTNEEMELVVLAGLLHDIGHLDCAEKDLLSLHKEMEQQCNEKHSHVGYKLVMNKALDIRVKQAILTHHERMDGSGFPMGITYTNISHITRILSIADMYSTLSMEEPGNPAKTPFEILTYLGTYELGKFDSGYLLEFMSHIAQNYIQHRVRLSNGKIGTIVMLNKLALTKPLVQVGEWFVDLAVQKDLEIKEILD